MRLLLDTHIVLWQLEGSRVIGDEARQAIDDADELAFSVVSFAEIGVKMAVGKLTVPEDFHAHVLGTGVRILGLSPEHGLGVASLPLHHRDPFDRLLIAQAAAEGMVIATADNRFAAYDVPLVDAQA